MKERTTAPKTVDGIVTARTCGCCGHHEIGLLTPAGEYIPLRPGMQVRLIAESLVDEESPLEPSSDPSRES